MPMTGSKCLPVAAIRPSPTNPRRYFDEENLAELAASMDRNGLLQPIAVYPVGLEYSILHGERRWRAAITLMWQTIPALVLDAPTEEQALVMALVENLQREDLSPIEEAEAFDRLYQGGMPQKEIASRIGRTKGYVSNRIRLLRLPEPVKELLSKGALSSSWGEALLWWEDEPERCAILAERAAAEGSLMTLPVVEQMARQEGRIQQRKEKGTKGGESVVMEIPRPTMENWHERRSRDLADIRARAGERRAYAEDLMAVMQQPLTSIRAFHDHKRLALIAYHVLIQIGNGTLLPILAAHDVEHLAKHLDGFSVEPVESAWEALAALPAETLVNLPADALLAAAVDRYVDVAEDPRAAKWYAGVEE